MEKQNNEKAKDKMAVVNPYISIITLNVTGLNSPIKKHRVDRWIKKKEEEREKEGPNYMLPTGDSSHL